MSDEYGNGFGDRTNNQGYNPPIWGSREYIEQSRNEYDRGWGGELPGSQPQRPHREEDSFDD